MTRSLLTLAASALLSFAAIACSSAEPSGKSAMCSKADDCSPDTASPHKPSGSTSTPSGTSQDTDPTAPVETHQAMADAGPDAAPPADAGPDATKTTSCQMLMTCCGELKAQGYDNTACKSVVTKNDQPTCLQKLASYQSFGDCSQ